MKPKKFKKVFQKALDRRILTGDNTLLLKIRRDIDREIRRFRRWNILNGHIPCDGPGVKGMEYKEVRLTLLYFQDRWYADWRLQWILDGLNNGKI